MGGHVGRLFGHGRQPKHARRRLRPAVQHRCLATVGVTGLVGALLCVSIVFGDLSANASGRQVGAQNGNASLSKQFAAQTPPVSLPAATAPPAPAPPTLVAEPPLQPHELFGFAPWWNLGDEAAFDVQDFTTLAYFSVDVNPNGTVDQSDSGWVGYESEALADLVNRAHAADDRVVLTATCFDQQSLNELTSNPSAWSQLGTTLIQLISAKNLDGVNFDFEGQGPDDRQGLDDMIATVSSELRAADPHWQVTMSTYASSAGDPSGFFDIAGLAPSVDAFFVMAYDMNDPSTPSPTAPLSGPGNVDAVDLAEYMQIVPRSKIILGVPYYGYDWPTTGPNPGDPATGPPTAVTYAQIAAQDLPSYWDQTSQTPWTAYQSGSQWHQVYYDDPTSLALKARLADADGIAGLGVWALGMDGNDPAMLAALLGSAAPAKFSPAPAAASSAASGPSTTIAYSYQGVYNDVTEVLQPVTSPLPGGGEAHTAGHLSSFSTNDPARACLSQGAAPPVYELVSSPTTYVVQTSTPSSCAAGTWEFTAPAGASGSSSGTSGGANSTTTSSSTTTTTEPALTLPLLSAPSSTSTASTEPDSLLP